MEKKTSGMAIAAFATGLSSLILGWLPLIGWMIVVSAIVLGIVALVQIKKDKNLKGKGFAITGIVIGSIMFLLYMLMVVFLVIFQTRMY